MTKKSNSTHLPCPCGGSSDAYAEYEDGHGFCFSCSKPFNHKKLKPEDLDKKFVDGYRSISAKTCEFMGIHSYVDEDDNVIFREYEGPTGSKFRRCPKEDFWVKGKVPALGGTNLWNPGSSHYVTVVEGEEDAAAFHEIMNTGKTVYPVVWLASASIPSSGRKSIHNYLSKFETVKVAIEDDKPGQRAKEILRELLPNKIREVPMVKHKDTNAFLMAGDADEFKRSWNNAPLFTPDNIFHTEEEFQGILNNNEVESYVETPFEELNDKIKGLSLNFVTLVTGSEGIGKTEFLRALEYKVISEDIPIAVLHQEETKKTFLKKMAGYKLKKDCCDPDSPVDNKEILRAVKELSGNFKKLWYFEFKTDPDVLAIMEQVKYLVHVCGVKYIFIDPINQFDPVDETRRVDFLDELSKKMAKFVSANPVGIVWTAHVNDDGSVRDSRMIAKSAGVRISLDRDVMSDEETERNRLAISVSKNRPFGSSGNAGYAVWDTESKTMTSPEDYYEDSETRIKTVAYQDKSEIIPF